jgi:hypothetical protein
VSCNITEARPSNPPSAGHFTLLLSQPRIVPPQFQTKWKEILKRARYRSSAPSLIFLGELLELLDNGSRCRFSQRYTGASGMGIFDRTWILETGKLRIYRRWGAALTESWSRLEDVDIVEISGFEGETKLLWDGYLGGGTGPMKAELLAISEQVESRVVFLARELFSEVEICRASETLRASENP